MSLTFRHAPSILFATLLLVLPAAAAAAGGSAAPQEVMSALAEALVATALGLVVAIPEVAMYNVFQRQSRTILANTEALSHVLLAHLTAEPKASADNS